MTEYPTRYAVRVESVSFFTGEVSIGITLGNSERTLTTRDEEVIQKLKEWNLASGASVFLYYRDTEHWDIKRPSINGHMIDKNFRKTDEEDA